VRELDALDVVRGGTCLSRRFQDLVWGDVDEFGFRLDESSDQPGTGNSVDLWTLARDPFPRSCAEFATCWESRVDPTGKATLEISDFDTFGGQCRGYALADFLSISTIGHDGAPRRLRLPKAYVVRVRRTALTTSRSATANTSGRRASTTSGAEAVPKSA
jgi:hypothetical protein